MLNESNLNFVFSPVYCRTYIGGMNIIGFVFETLLAKIVAIATTLTDNFHKKLIPKGVEYLAVYPALSNHKYIYYLLKLHN